MLSLAIMATDDGCSCSTDIERGVARTTRTLSSAQSDSDENVPIHSSGHRCVSANKEDIYDVAGSTIVVTLLILSPPIVLIGVILLTTGAIISRIFILIAGLATMLSGVLVAASTAFVFVRMRGGAARQRKYSSERPNVAAPAARARCGGNGSGRSNYYRVTMDLERSTNSADGSFRVEITDQPTAMVTFFSTADAETHQAKSSKGDGSDSSGSVSSGNGNIRAIEIKRIAENTNPR